MQARVVSRHLSGESKREIARVEGIGRDTVGRILSQEETVQMITRQRSRLQGIADKALDVVERALVCDDARLAVPVAMKIIEHVFPKCGIGDTANSQPKLSPEAEERDRQLASLLKSSATTLNEAACMTSRSRRILNVCAMNSKP